MTDDKENDDMTSSLTSRMRTSTKAVHDKSDRLVNLKLALVLTSPRLYGESIALFAAIYERLECILQRQASHPQLGKFHELLPFISRTKGFQADLSYYLTTCDAPRHKMSKSGDSTGANSRNDSSTAKPSELCDYLDRLDTLEKEEPTRLIAYIYHMYMAIFAGGFIIKKIVKKSMGIAKDSDIGVQAFCIEHPNDDDDDDPRSMTSKKIRTEMKRLVDHVIAPTLNEKEIEGILNESNEVFRRNNLVVNSVKGTPAFQIAATKCRNFVLIPTLVVILGTALALSGFGLSRFKT